MGMFSWFTQDTNHRIVNGEPFNVIMTDDKGRKYIEHCYQGYGVFGGKDYYELLAEMNGLGPDRDAVPVSVSCVLNSTDFEEAIRNAMIVGGDSDTIGAITGGIAEAMYGIPENLKDIAMSYLPDGMRDVITQLYEQS